MDLRKLKTLIDLVSDSNVTELEITEAEGKVRIVKGNTSAPQAYSSAAPSMNLMAAAATPAGVAEPLAAVAAPIAAAVVEHHVVKSPMVGTFYRCASPGAPSFVELGSNVKQGETVCIIEAMKILNEIEADKTGTIRRILCDNGQAVEYGQPLFEIE
jgi:acetyl-CoA carboxylase biotin carboxyl carrier protein